MNVTDEPISIDNLIKRRMVWDCLPHDVVPTSLAKMGLLPGSESGNKIEHRDSHKRLSKLGLIQGELLLFSVVAGEIIGRAILENQGLDSSEIDELDLQNYLKAVHAGVVGVLSALVDGELVTINTGDF